MPRRSSSIRRIVYAVLGVLALAGLVQLAMRYAGRPANGPRELVIDGAGLIDADRRAYLARYHGFLKTDHDIDYRVETVGGERAADIEGYAVRRFAELGVGSESAAGRGLLLVVDAGHDRVRLEVGRALEGVYTDAFVTYVQHRQMVPFFRSGRVADGIVATTELIVSKAQEAKKASGFGADDGRPGTLGGGATAKAHLGEPDATPGAAPGPDVAAASTPEGALKAYLAAMAARDARAGLDLYTPETRRMLARWTVTPAQMDSVLRTYRRCHAEPARFNANRTLSVIRYPIAERQCAPWFFRGEGGRWRLDLTMMQKAIRFGRSNAWRFNLGVRHDYGFAFADWRYDRHGFPMAKRAP